MESLDETLKRLKGEPIEIITESGFKICGIDMETGDKCEDDNIVIIDEKGRLVHVMKSHIDVLIEPHMQLEHIITDIDCNNNNNNNNNDCDCRDVRRMRR